MTETGMFDTRIAGLNIRIQHQFAVTKRFFTGYLVCDASAPDLQVRVPAEGYSNAGEEFLKIHQQLAQQFPSFDRLLIHGAAIAYDGNGYLFMAPSGTGKSTHIRLWRKWVGQKVDIVNGDKPVLHVTEKQILVCGTPWAGKERWQRNVIVPLRGICLLHRGENAICRAAFSECAEELLQQVYIPENDGQRIRTMELLESILMRVPLYHLDCDMSEASVRTSFEALTGEAYINRAGGAE